MQKKIFHGQATVNTKVIGTLLGLFLCSTPALSNDQFVDRGRVLKVTPQYSSVNNPTEECRTEYQRVTPNASRNMTGTVIGGIAGGLLGSQIGKGNGRVAAAAIGAGIGAITGDRISQNRRVNTESYRKVPVDVCYQVDNWQQQKTGYWVEYEYRGRQYAMQSATHPGKFIDLNVTVTPVATSFGQSNQYLSEYDTPTYRTKHRRHRRHRHQQVF